MTIFQKVYNILTKKQQHKAIMLIFCMIIGAILEAVGVGAIWPLMQMIGNESYLKEHSILATYVANFGINDDRQLIVIAACLLIAFYLLKNIFCAFEIKLQTNFIVLNQIETAQKMLTYYLDKPYLYHVNHNSAILYRNIDIGTNAIYSQLVISVLAIITETITAIIIWLMVAFIEPTVAIIAALLLTIFICLLMRQMRHKLAEKGDIKYKFSAQYLKWLSQALGSIKETKVMQKEPFFLEQFKQAYKGFGLASGDYMFLNQIPRMIIETAVLTALLLLVIFKVLNGEPVHNIVAVLSVLALAAFRLMPCANRIVGYWGTIKFHTPLFNELYDDYIAIKNYSYLSLDNGASAESMKFYSCISFKDISFQYPETTRPVLNHVNLSIPKGSFVGIVGSTGAGKTTFVDLLLGLLKPIQGNITVDGVDINNNISGWRKNLAYVPQSIYLFDGTIKDNIEVGDADASNDKLDKILRMAEIYDLVHTLPNGIDTVVGERGVKLSGGQKQRIGIARALYCEPTVLILDEATSALDNEVEASITETLLKLKGKITIISIAHRLSTLETCDFKLKVDNGTVEVLKS